MEGQTRQNITINEHPESKIRFLEQTLMGKDWRATIPVGEGRAISEAEASTLTAELLDRGYTVERTTDDLGKPLLSIHHIGADSDARPVGREAGFLRGLRQFLAHPIATLKKPAGYATQGYDWVSGSLHDPARANGIFNTTAEGFLIAAGAGAQYGKFTDPKNALQSMAGLSWLSQSMVYMFFAKNNETRAFNIIRDKIDHTLKTGGDVTALAFNHTTDAEKNGLTDKFSRFIHRFPVTVGAVLNNMGMVFYIGHAFLEQRYRRGLLKTNPHDADALKYVSDHAKGFVQWAKTGFGKDIIGATLSLVGWSVLMVPPTKHVPESDQLADRSPLRKAWDTFRENTPTIAGLFTLGASSFRLMGAKDKRNKWQQTGETVYIGGDVALMFTNSHEYGGDAKMNQDKLSDLIVNYVGQLPFIYGAKEQENLATTMMQYWMDKYRADAPLLGKKPESYKAWVERSATETKQQTMRKLRHQQTERLEHIAECAAEVIAHFPSAQQPEVTEKLLDTLSAMPWMKAPREEITQHVAHAFAKLPKREHTSVNSAHVAGDVSALSSIVPNTDAVSTISSIYDALAPYMRASKPVAEHAIAHTPPAHITQPQPTTKITQANRLASLVPQASTLVHA